ncbi:MAG: hypothetical protein FJ285_07715 [Planctomycetes bacterium]|nr:hypothetical protein [Planctomycetota bacterium]
MGGRVDTTMMHPWIRLLRPSDWVKNVFVLVPIVFWLPGAGRGSEASVVQAKGVSELLAFAAFCLAASGWYCINDALDAAEDRLHPIKRRRPVASGQVATATALMLGVVIAAAAMGVAAAVNAAVVWAVVTYLVLQAFYNIGLKRLIFVDAATIATGFCVRAVAGALAIDVPVSIWLVLCVFFLTLYLAFIKRMCDLSASRRAGPGNWKPRAGYGDAGELNWLLSISGGLTVLMFLMYTLSSHAQGLFGVRAFGLAMLTPLVLIVVHRFYHRAMQGLSDSPLEALRTDRVVLMSVALFSFGVWLALYASGIEDALRRALLI